MVRSSPLMPQHRAYLERLAAGSSAAAAAERPGAATGHRIAPNDLETLPYGPPAGVPSDDASGASAGEIIATFGEVEPEYAALRRGAGLMDCPQRGTLLLTGTERRDFLNRMVTQELKGLDAGIVRRTFWLNRKGRIEADLALVELGDRMLVDVDIHQAASTVRGLESFLFAEDVAVRDMSTEWHRVSVHGPMSLAVIAAAGDDPDFTLGEFAAATICIVGHEVIAARWDETGEPGVHLFIPIDHAVDVWKALLESDESDFGGKRRIRPIGWYAWNIARIEAGTPIFNIDFGVTNLPHESGLLEQRVNFSKGCYLGQEVVARMEHLGQPKQKLVGLRIEGDALPVSGGQVFAVRDDGSMGDQVGMVTSSTLSPMLGAAPVAFAMLRTREAAPGGRVLVNAEGRQAEATIQNLTFLPARAPSTQGEQPDAP